MEFFLGESSGMRWPDDDDRGRCGMTTRRQQTLEK